MNDSPAGIASIVGFVGRWLTFVGVLGAFGSVVFRLAVLGRAALDAAATRSLARRAARCGSLTAVCVIPGVVTRIYFQVAEMRFPGDPWIALGWKLLTHSAWGYLTLGQLILAIIASVGLRIAAQSDSARIWRMLGGVTLLLVVSPSLASHAMSGHSPKALTVPADMLHLLGASAWLGTLLAMFVAWRGDDARDTSTIAALLARFSPIALGGAACVVASGVVSSYAHLASVAELTSTTYGRLLLVKVALVLGVAVLGWRNWKLVTPRLAEVGGHALRRSIITELVFAAVVIAATSVLTITPPPMH